MNKDLQSQYDTLSQSILKLNFVTSQFMMKVQDVSNQIADQFIKNKSKIKNTKRFNPNIDQAISRDIIAYQDSLIHRFKHCYKLTFNFIQSYIQKTFLIQTNLPEELFKICLMNNIITKSEHAKLLKLANEFELIATTIEEQEISEEIIQYCILMHKIVDRFKNIH